ncbi:dTDP-4-amino-4,6-dideoxyglucose formyltransferase [uncultured Chryseobacterium sp.]|uniref:dTDP-4-amino-4,6-dideoxyglucose formyltransferase n=1 Tax=uncultured Chryseobacterium sp. TaxID=259322 RepID=UPI0025EEE3C3|nr:dTDP-4-amino-4,6-dideoxyglucose formyltransferase [uncultured Chryseobacterium sp.]
MKKILIISDNLQLCKSVRKISLSYLNNFAFSYSISPFSDKQKFDMYLEESTIVFDLKKQEDIRKIIDSYDLVISIHCKQLFPELLYSNVKCINVHPGYNPINRGWYPQVFAIVNNLMVGATIHEIDEQIDHGNIIARAFVEKEIIDTSKTLYDKILNKELQLLEENIDSILNNNYTTIVPESEGNVYLKKDFNKLCKIDLEEKVTMLESINKLRALTHGDFENAYFIDPISNRKVIVSINLKYQD